MQKFPAASNAAGRFSGKEPPLHREAAGNFQIIFFPGSPVPIYFIKPQRT